MLRNSSVLLLLFIFLLIILFYQLKYTIDPSVSIKVPVSQNNEKFKIISNEYSSLWYQKHCLKTKLAQKLVVEDLVKYLNNAHTSKNQICRQFATIFYAIFRLEEMYGLLKLSPVYLNKINQWLHNDQILIEQIKKQVIFISK
ncbi:unnamed protein product [Rotaria socialis]|uniref:Uncharacterized protein n=1 Tax=Rotaria socialis TaxID=392032 RepID=A0A821Z5L5_9BILA|nr:unnamed protein product [Rotaria socialis]